MLTGHVLFDRGTDLAKLWSHANEPPPKRRSLRPELPHDLEDVIERALAKDPERASARRASLPPRRPWR